MRLRRRLTRAEVEIDMGDSTVRSGQQSTGASGGGRPWFSVITPVWNRSATIRRCLDSVLSQDFEDLEVIAVDDGSQDDSLEILRRYHDPRVTVLSRAENRGASSARRLGTARSRGRWLVYLDSDDMLLPGGLARCFEVTRSLAPEQGFIGFAYERDTGVVTPCPFPPRGFVGLREYVQWAFDADITDFFGAYRREVRLRFPWPDSHTDGLPSIFRIVSEYGFYFRDEVVGKVFTDAPNRIERVRASAAGYKRRLASTLRDAQELLSEFGPVIRDVVPRHYANMLSWASLLYFVSEDRLKGWRYAIESLRRRPLSPRAWLTLAIGLAYPQLLLELRERMSR